MRILCFGDSNTHGSLPLPAFDAERARHEMRWPRVLAAELGQGAEVVEEGQPGRTTVHDDPIEGAHRNGLKVLPAILESHWPLDVVAIKLGTNDLKQRFGLTTQDVALGAGRLVRCCREYLPDARVLLISPPPARECGCLAEIFSGAEQRSAGLAEAMARVAAREGAAFLDAGAHIAVDPLDGIHYDAAAHETLGRAVAAAIRELAA